MTDIDPSAQEGIDHSNNTSGQTSLTNPPTQRTPSPNLEDLINTTNAMFTNSNQKDTTIITSDDTFQKVATSSSNSSQQEPNSNTTSNNIAATIAATATTTTTTVSVENNSTSHQHQYDIEQQKQQQQQQQQYQQLLLKAKRDLESMVLKYAKSEQENLKNKQKVDELDKKLKRAIKDNDQLANRIKLLSNDKNQLADNLSGKVAQLTVLEQKNTYLNSIQGVKLKNYEENIEHLEQSNKELEKQLEDYKSKQTELLDFSERLSMKHMMLQTELDEALKKVPHFKEQHENSLRKRDAAIQQRELLSEQIDNLSESLTNEQKLTESLKNLLVDSERKYQSIIDEHDNEIKIMRRKHQMATRELMKEIKQLQLRLVSGESTTEEEPFETTQKKQQQQQINAN